MLHLFNKCYVYPDILFDSTTDFVVVGSQQSYGSKMELSSFYFNASNKQCLGRFQTYEEFVASEFTWQILNHSKENTVRIYMQKAEFVKAYAGLFKTMFLRPSEQFFLTSAKLLAHRLRTRAKIVVPSEYGEKINELADELYYLQNIPNVKAFPVAREWIKAHSGVEWQIAKARCSGITSDLSNKITDLIYRYIHSYHAEASHKYLSRCEVYDGKEIEHVVKFPNESWATNPSYSTYDRFVNEIGILSIGTLYEEIRKHTTPFADLLVLNFLNTKDVNAVLNDPKFLLILAGNGNKGEKIDTWFIRNIMQTDPQTIESQGLLA